MKHLFIMVPLFICIFCIIIILFILFVVVVVLCSGNVLWDGILYRHYQNYYKKTYLFGESRIAEVLQDSQTDGTNVWVRLRWCNTILFHSHAFIRRLVCFDLTRGAVLLTDEGEKLLVYVLQTEMLINASHTVHIHNDTPTLGEASWFSGLNMTDLVWSSVSRGDSHTAEAQDASHTAAGAQQLPDHRPVLLFEGQHAEENNGRTERHMLYNMS